MMCGIIAYKSKVKTPEHIDTLLKLIYESKIRGLHSFGYSYFDRTMITKKLFVLPSVIDDFAQSKSSGFIYHNRYSTSGDWKVIDNIQPLSDGDISIAMNGVISMAPREEFEKEYNIKCTTENDSEIFLRLLLQGKDPEEIIHRMKGSCAVVWLNKNNVYAIRNSHRPLHYFYKNEAIFICSTSDIANRAVGAVTTEIKPYKLFDLDKYV
jgi:glutamine phosphoribosylpyrophosphate amidotransferase